MKEERIMDYGYIDLMTGGWRTDIDALAKEVGKTNLDAKEFVEQLLGELHPFGDRDLVTSEDVEALILQYKIPSPVVPLLWRAFRLGRNCVARHEVQAALAQLKGEPPPRGYENSWMLSRTEVYAQVGNKK